MAGAVCGETAAAAVFDGWLAGEFGAGRSASEEAASEVDLGPRSAAASAAAREGPESDRRAKAAMSMKRRTAKARPAANRTYGSDADRVLTKVESRTVRRISASAGIKRRSPEIRGLTRKTVGPAAWESGRAIDRSSPPSARGLRDRKLLLAMRSTPLTSTAVVSKYKAEEDGFLIFTGMEKDRRFLPISSGNSTNTVPTAALISPEPLSADNSITGEARDSATTDETSTAAPGGGEVPRRRRGVGGDDPVVVRADGAVCWRASVQRHTPAARRLHYWKLGDQVELSRVALHDDTRP